MKTSWIKQNNKTSEKVIYVRTDANFVYPPPEAGYKYHKGFLLVEIVWVI